VSWKVVVGERAPAPAARPRRPPAPSGGGPTSATGFVLIDALLAVPLVAVIRSLCQANISDPYTIDPLNPSSARTASGLGRTVIVTWANRWSP